MPQVDKATFLPIVFWVFVIYVGGFLLLNTISLFTFISDLKLTTKRAAAKVASVRSITRASADFMLFPLVAL